MTGYIYLNQQISSRTAVGSRLTFFTDTDALAIVDTGRYRYLDLLLDEPAAGMNPNETQELMDTIRFVREHFDMTVLLIEHDMKLVGGICEELTVLNFGQVLIQGETSAVLKDPTVITAYLGE